MSRSVPTVESRLPRRLSRRWRTAVVTVAVAAAAIAGATGLPLAGGGTAARAAVMAAPRAAALVPAESFLPPANGILVFTGHGWGHGIGMSQWGAYGAATQGLTAAQILDFYYPGTTPTPIDPNMRARLQLTNNGLDMTVAPVAANGVLSFTDVAAGTTIALPTTVNGAPVIAYRAAQSAGSTMLQANWGSGFQPYLPDGTNPLVVSGVARFTTASGIVRLVNPGAATQVDLRGTVDAVQIGGFVRTIETLGMDEMLPSVVGKEMAADWPTAALQAQTVSARSYAAFQVAAHTAQPFDLAIPKDFAYEGIARYDASGATRIAGWDDPRLLAAVHAFPGDVRTSGGQPIFAMFASSSGGFTVARPGMPYLVAKADPYDAVAVNGHHTWKVSVGVDKVAAAYPAIGSLTSIAVGSRDGNGEWGGRILTLTVNGTAGAVNDTGSGFAAKLGLQSPWWNLPNQGDPSGALESVQAAPGGARVVGWAYDPKTTAPIAVHLYVDGHLSAGASANIDRPDLAAQLPAGTAHGFAATLAMGAGGHTVCAYAINSAPGGKNPQLGCSAVQTFAGGPIGVASVTSGIGGVLLGGWTVDPESVGPVAVRVKVDGNLAASTYAGADYPAVAGVLPFYGAAHGISFLLPLSGTHTVCAVAVNVGPGADTTLACARVTVFAGAPIGALDAVIPKYGGVALWGWAVDPDTVAPIPVHVYVDGQVVAGLAATHPRADVQAYLPAYGGGHGYEAIVPMASGKHTVCTWALNVVGAGGNPQLGCKTVTVPTGDPVGHLDAVAVSGGKVFAWGWAADPKQPAAPILVHLYLDGVLASFGPASLAVPTADVPAVKAAGYGLAHGFFAGAPVTPGAHRLCVYAINSASGANNPQLGCTAFRA